MALLYGPSTSRNSSEVSLSSVYQVCSICCPHFRQTLDITIKTHGPVPCARLASHQTMTWEIQKSGTMPWVRAKWSATIPSNPCSQILPEHSMLYTPTAATNPAGPRSLFS